MYQLNDWHEPESNLDTPVKVNTILEKAHAYISHYTQQQSEAEDNHNRRAAEITLENQDDKDKIIKAKIEVDDQAYKFMQLAHKNKVYAKLWNDAWVSARKLADTTFKV